MAELVDATDLKSVGTLLPCRFDSGFPHHIQVIENNIFSLTYFFDFSAVLIFKNQSVSHYARTKNVHQLFRFFLVSKVKEPNRRTILITIVAIIAIFGPEISAKTPNKYMIIAAIMPFTTSIIDCIVAR